MAEHLSYGHIESFDAVFHYVRKHYEKYPKNIYLTGTVKIHGSNCSVCDTGSERWYQSRKQIITKANDYFLNFAMERKEAFDDIFAKIRQLHLSDMPYTAVVFGEFFGEGIQKGVAVNKLPKSYAIFDVELCFADGGKQWLPSSEIRQFSHPDERIYSVYDFQTFGLDVSVYDPEEARARAAQFAQSVEDECPVGKALGVDGPGEGIVWLHPETAEEPFRLRFKMKGRKFAETDKFNAGQMKGKEHKSQNPPKPKVFQNLEELQERIETFLNIVITDARVEQGLQENDDFESFRKWLVADIMREEREEIVRQKLLAGPLVLAIRSRAKNLYAK